MALVLSVAAVIHAHGAVHKVGDSAGWTTIGSPDYKQWAVTKTFELGDVIRKSRSFWFPFTHTTCVAGFEYNPQFHNVMRVTHAMYRACNTTAPLATYTTGNDSITITTRGHHYFICGVNGHCQSGQRVDINVLPTTATPSSSPASSMAAPTLSSAQSPGPSSNTAASSMASIAQALLLAMAILFHVGFA
ncbi:unnamed protein product [Linum tenue]|uniref:Phytocyanin domain-containing protein n=1 Tax=Linum tenue TaxID=586396 RepID=A0AAV0P5H1_9ROSI|nr:unnamed protein product [Linum tenue]